MLVALGVTGGIGAYKAVEVARGLQKRGHEVVAVMTHAATKFVGAVTFEAITRRPVITDQWDPGANADIEHISLASSIDLLLIAPATANVIGKLANGIADDFLTTLYTATRAPVLVAPAMNSQMFSHEAVRRNLDRLAADGVRFVEPGEGYLACGWVGKGRLAEPDEICAAAEALLRPGTTLAGIRVLVTAGPTLEDLDPVRFIGNRSSGRMGFAVADEATRRGALVTLVAGPTSAPRSPWSYATSKSMTRSPRPFASCNAAPPPSAWSSTTRSGVIRRAARSRSSVVMRWVKTVASRRWSMRTMHSSSKVIHSSSACDSSSPAKSTISSGSSDSSDSSSP